MLVLFNKLNKWFELRLKKQSVEVASWEIFQRIEAADDLSPVVAASIKFFSCTPRLLITFILHVGEAGAFVECYLSRVIDRVTIVTESIRVGQEVIWSW